MRYQILKANINRNILKSARGIYIPWFGLIAVQQATQIKLQDIFFQQQKEMLNLFTSHFGSKLFKSVVFSFLLPHVYKRK